jgi:hypothetical protein
VVQKWVAARSDEHGHAFTRRQAREIRKALVQVMKVGAAAMEADVLARIRNERSY